MSKRITRSEVNRIRTLAADGYGSTRIGRALERSVDTIRIAALRHGISLPFPGAPNFRPIIRSPVETKGRDTS